MSWADERYNALVIGGGIYGVLLALEGAARGEKVLLIERDDFGGATSFNHLRTIHGGLRYLQYLDVWRALESNRQRLWWLQNLPDLVQPQPCLMPLYGEGLRRPATFCAAFTIAELFGLDRDAEGVKHPMHVVSREEVARCFPLCRTDRLQGGALWHDAFMVHPHRVMAELLHWAESAGATLRNRAEFVACRRSSDGKAWVASILDLLTGEHVAVRTRLLVNAAGPAVDEVTRRMIPNHDQPLLIPTLAWGFLIDRPPVSTRSIAVAAPGRGRHTWFLHPYHGRILAGTGHAGFRSSTGAFSELPQARVRESMNELNEAIPGLSLTMSDIAHVFRGILPGATAGSDALQMRPVLVDHGKRHGAPDCWSVLGVKFTEAPIVAQRVWNAIGRPRQKELPARPAYLSVPSIQECSEMSDESLGACISSLASKEWAANVEDLLWRRTNLWMDPSLASRIRAIDARLFNEPSATNPEAR